LRLDKANRVKQIIIAFGGMAATPKRATMVENLLMGQVWNEELIEKGMAVFAQDYQPLSDVRGSAEYRLLCAQNLLKRFYLETQGQVHNLKRGVA
jgi:xanthine dehydrogenase small subunit